MSQQRSSDHRSPRANCWEIRLCGRGSDGNGSCAAGRAVGGSGLNGGLSGGRVCWAVPGTVCDGDVQGNGVEKLDHCGNCEVFHLVLAEEGAGFDSGASVVFAEGSSPDGVKAFDRLVKATAQVRALSGELLHAQKLAAIGTLAAGIAHEINTPIQFVRDSVNFLADSSAAALALIDTYRQALRELGPETDLVAMRARLAAAEDTADLAYVRDNSSGAFSRAGEGLARISTIVSAMKEFAHRDRAEQAPADLNRALQATLTIARNEYRYVADVETEFGDLPMVTCHLSALNQVFVNLIVNAAHAIADRKRPDGQRGLIRVRTTCHQGSARIQISDDGAGIPPEIRARIFEPFFTTKEVGRGSGQGLAIAREIVVARHRGSITFESAVGQGTTFTIDLPLKEL